VGLTSSQNAGRITGHSLRSTRRNRSQITKQPPEPWFGPAVKYICAAGAAAASLLLGLTFPGLSAQTPLMASGFPLASRQSVKFPVASRKQR